MRVVGFVTGDTVGRRVSKFFLRQVARIAFHLEMAALYGIICQGMIELRLGQNPQCRSRSPHVLYGRICRVCFAFRTLCHESPSCAENLSQHPCGNRDKERLVRFCQMPCGIDCRSFHISHGLPSTGQAIPAAQSPSALAQKPIR